MGMIKSENWNNSELIIQIHKLLNRPDSIDNKLKIIQYLGNLQRFQIKPKFPHEAYARTVRYSTEGLEVMIASWNQNQECLPHNHGASKGLVINLIGQFEETFYAWRQGTLTPVHSVLHKEEGSILEIGVSSIHSMHCKDVGGLTLHIYAPAIDKMKVFDLKNSRTLTVVNNCGAWIPLEQDQIINENYWKSSTTENAKTDKMNSEVILCQI